MRMSGIVTINSRTMVGENSSADLEVFKEIEQVFFSSGQEVDPGRYVLERAPSDCTAIEEMFVRLKRQQQVVSNKALHLISQKRDQCDREFKEITTVQQDLNNTITTCRLGRQKLKSAKTNLTTSTFGILANFRKRQIVQGLLRSLNLISHLRQAEEEVQTLVRNREYDAAITLVLEGQKAAADHRHFKCVVALTQRLQDTLNLAEEQLDGVLASVCYKFDAETYTKLQRAYSLLDKTQVAMDQLHMHFASAINISALEALKSHQREPVEPGSHDHVNLKDLCANVRETSVVVCLLDLCDRLWAVMLSYHCVVEWHARQDATESLQINGSASEFEANVNKEYVRQKLKNGLTRIWHDVQSKVSTFLIQSGLPQYPFEKFVQVLGILKRLIEVAEEFCGDTSDSLQTFIKSHSLTYLKSYHAGRMEVLRIFLENEGWEICPVKASFNVLQLQEFDRIKRHIKACTEASSTPKQRYTSMSTKTVSSDASSSIHSQDDSMYVGKYFATYHRHTPFHIFRSENVMQEEIPDLDLDESDSQTEASDEEESEELTRDFIDESPTVVSNQSTGKPPSKKQSDPVIVTNTTLSVLRDCGQYLQMCRFLRPISFEVIMLMSQMFDYYLYSVHFFFASDLKVSSSSLYSQKLNSMLKRIANNLISSESQDVAADSIEEAGRYQKTIKPTSSQTISLDNPENLYGLSERIVAIESLLFLSKQFEILQPYLESLVPPHQRIILQTFYEQTVTAAADLRIPIFMCVASQAFNVRTVLVSMSQVNWEVRNVMSQHSQYVDHIVRDLQVFSMRLDQVAHTVKISSDVHRILWSAVAKFVVHTLVEGFSNVSKCSDSGRGLMQLDYTQLLSKLTKISGIKPVPHQEYVDTYVKAYYLTKPDLEEFIKVHTEYSNKHLIALVNCACDSKKSRQELIAVVESKENQSPMKTNPKNLQ